MRVAFSIIPTKDVDTATRGGIAFIPILAPSWKETAIPMKKPERKSSKSKRERPVFSAIRKPQAPPGHPLSQAKPEERAHPAGRKAKHKQRPSSTDGDE